MAMLSVSEASERLGVDERRVRALLQDGKLAGQRVGAVWVVDAASVQERQDSESGVRARPFSTRTAWSAGALMDGLHTPWLDSSERSRLRTRLRKLDVANSKLFRRWMRERGHRTRYRVADGDIPELLASESIVLGGVSAASARQTGIGHGGEAEIYADAAIAEHLREKFFLVPSTKGNLSIHIVDTPSPWHLRASINGNAPRLVVAADLLDAQDTRSRTAGRLLLRATLEGDHGNE